MQGLRSIFEADDEGRQALRNLGGLLFGVAMILIFFRRSVFGDPWGDFALLLVLLVPCVFLYGSALLGYLSSTEDRAWLSVYGTFGILLVPLVLFQFVELVNGNTDAPLNTAWIFLVTAVAAAVAALVGNVRYGLLLASIALIFSWLGLWDEILSEGLAGDFGTFRGLLMLIAAVLVAGYVGLYMVDRDRGLAWGSEIITGAGIAVVLGAGLISFTKFGDVPVTPPTPTLEGTSTDFNQARGAGPSLFWDAVLLIGSLLLVAYGSRFRARGPVYVGAIGLFLFALLVGLDLDADEPEGSILGWPLLLLILGLAAIVVSAIPGLKIGSLGIDRLEPDGDGPGGPARPGGAPTAPRPPAGAPPSSGEPPPPSGTPPSS